MTIESFIRGFRLGLQKTAAKPSWKLGHGVEGIGKGEERKAYEQSVAETAGKVPGATLKIKLKKKGKIPGFKVKKRLPSGEIVSWTDIGRVPETSKWSPHSDPKHEEFMQGVRSRLGISQ